MTDRVARLRLRVRNKETRETYMAFWPWKDGVALCWKTGHVALSRTNDAVLTFNDRGEKVLERKL